MLLITLTNDHGHRYRRNGVGSVTTTADMV